MIMEEWKEYKLMNICTELSDGLHKAPKFVSGGDYIFVNAKNISNGFIVDNDPTKKSTYEEYVKYSSPLNETTVLYSIDGTIGNIALYRGEKCILGKGACYLNPNPTKLDRMYLYYELQAPHFKLYIDKMSTGSTIKHISLKTMRNYEMKVPSINTQQRIVSILKSLDDKIEINRRINENLEQQAQALFKSWFVDFEPFKDGEFVESELGLIPKMWRVGHLDEILTIRKESYRKGDDINLPYLPIDIIPMHSLGIIEFKDNNEAQSSLQTFEKNDIIIGAMRVYFHRVVIAPCKGITRNTCFVLYPNSEDYWAYSVLQCNQKDTIDFANRTSKGSTMPYAVWNNGLGNCNIIIPNSETMRQFNIIAKHLLIKIRDSYKESRRLAELRDTLLPRLMSGEIDINKVCI